MPLSLSATLGVRGSQTNALDLGTTAFPLDALRKFVFTDGTAADQATKLFTDNRTLSGNANEDLDLSGVLLDPFGATIAFTKLKGLYLYNYGGTNVNPMTLSRPAANGVPLFAAASDGITIRPGGAFLWVAPDSTAIAVTAGTGDLINVANVGSGNNTYDIVIWGV